MDKKAVMELKKRFKKEECTITQIYSIYYNAEGERICSRYENFLVMKENEEKDFYKYLEILKKGISLKNNDLYFKNEENEFKKNLNIINKDKLKTKEVLDVFIDKIAESYLKETMSNILVTLVCDSYDIPAKTTDGFKVDESEEVYSYIFCTICPVTTSKAGLGYIEKDNKISSRYQDFIVNPPELGFIYPNFIERSTDDTCVAFFNKNLKKEYLYLIENVLGCEKKDIVENYLKTNEEIDEVNSSKIFEDNERKEIIEKNINVKEISFEKEKNEISLNLNDDSKIIQDKKNDENILVDKLDDTSIESINNKEENYLVLNEDNSFKENNNMDIANPEINDEINNEQEKEEFNKFLKKINLLLDENKGLAEVKIIDGKKFLMIPMD